MYLLSTTRVSVRARIVCQNCFTNNKQRLMFLKIRLDNTLLYIEVAAARELVIAFLRSKTVLEDFARSVHCTVHSKGNYYSLQQH